MHYVINDCAYNIYDYALMHMVTVRPGVPRVPAPCASMHNYKYVCMHIYMYALCDYIFMIMFCHMQTDSPVRPGGRAGGSASMRQNIIINIQLSILCMHVCMGMCMCMHNMCNIDVFVYILYIVCNIHDIHIIV